MPGAASSSVARVTARPAGAAVLSLRAADGVRLHGVHVPPAAGARSDLALVVAHGFAGHGRKPAVRTVVAALAAAGGVVAVDFRGHGRSAGVSTVGDREVLDVEAAVRWARRHGYARVVTVGFSMGGSVVVRHAALHGGEDDAGVDAVVSVSGPSRWFYRDTIPMRRLHWLVECRYGRVVARALLRIRLATGWDAVPESPTEAAALLAAANALRPAPVPLLVVHGDADAFFPVDHGRELAAAAGAWGTLWEEPGFGHAEAAASPELLARIGAWASSHAPTEGPAGRD